MAQTTSSQVLEFLTKQPVGFEFSAKDLEDYIPGVSKGGISGYIFKLREEGAISLADRVRINGRLRDIYTIVDMSKASAKQNFTPSDQTGRSGSPHPNSRQRLVDLLMSVASEIERMKIGICDYSDQELIKELDRRMKAHASS